MQTSLKRCGLKFSLRYDMSAKFPRGGGRTFFSSKSITDTIDWAILNIIYNEALTRTNEILTRVYRLIKPSKMNGPVHEISLMAYAQRLLINVLADVSRGLEF